MLVELAEHDDRPGSWRAKVAVNQNVEPAPSSLTDADLAAHQLDEALGDREPEAGAAEAPRRRRVRLGERLEERVGLSAAMPMPVSRTAKRSVALASDSSISPTVTVTSPRSVNLTALPSRLVST